MQLRHIETFLRIVDAGTLTAAATRLFKTQGAVSNDLKMLEAELGLTLVDRSGQRVRLTSAGESLLPLARRLLIDVEDIKAEMARVRDGASSTLRIGCLPSLGSRSSTFVAEFMRSAASSPCTLETALHNDLSAALRTRRLDLAIYEARSDQDIEIVPLESEPLRVVLRREHELAALDVLQARDLVGSTYIGLSREMGATAEAQRFFATVGAYPQPAVEVTDVQLVPKLVMELDGFGILPISSLDGLTGIVGVRTDPPLSRQVALGLLADRLRSERVLTFIDFLTSRWRDATSL